MPMRIGTPMPSLEGATEWISSSADEALKDAEGQPVLIHFWSVSCGMCKDNLPTVAEWRDKYRVAGLRLVAVHMPRYPEDTHGYSVREAVARPAIKHAPAIGKRRNM